MQEFRKVRTGIRAFLFVFAFQFLDSFLKRFDPLECVRQVQGQYDDCYTKRKV